MRILIGLVVISAASFGQPINKGGGSAVIACVGTPGNTAGAYRQQCQSAAGALFACNASGGCTVAGDWVAQQSNPFAVLYTNTEYDNGTCTTATTINPANGNRQKITLTNADTCAMTFTQPSGATVSIQLKIIQSSAGSFNGTISGGKWPGGSVPVITSTAGAVDISTCYLDGTNAYCVATQDFR